MSGQALVFAGLDRPEVWEIQLPALKPHEVLVETAYSCISPGTEMRCLAGKQDGARFPFIPGYSLSGRIAAAGHRVTLNRVISAAYWTLWRGENCRFETL